MRYRWLLLLMLMLALGGGAALAQDATTVISLPADDACPADLACVEHEGNIYELNPACGQVAGIVVVENIIVEKTIDNPEGDEVRSVRALIFVEDDQGDYQYVTTVGGPVSEFDDAELLYSGCMSWGPEDG